MGGASSGLTGDRYVAALLARTNVGLPERADTMSENAGEADRVRSGLVFIGPSIPL